MRRAVFLTLCALAALLPVFGTGCSPQDKYDQLLTAYRSTQEQLVAEQDRREEAEARASTWAGEVEQLKSGNRSIQTECDELRTYADRLQAQNDEFLNRIAQLELGPLPVDVESALDDLARAHPEFLSFDAKAGMVRFASDFTFGLGSVQLSDTATATITALAGILNGPAAKNLEARVVGHTDNVRIAKAETRRNHPTNVHLSVHRSIAVRDALVAAGVDPARIQVAGYGEFRPVVANETRGAAPNRRVEIYLGAMPKLDERLQATIKAATTDQSSAAAGTSTPEPMK